MGFFDSFNPGSFISGLIGGATGSGPSATAQSINAQLGGGSGSSSFWDILKNPQVIATGLQGLGTMAGELYKPRPYGDTEDAFSQNQALERERLAQMLAIARENAGAELAAAKIAAKARLIEAAQNARLGRQQIVGQGYQNLANLAGRTGEVGQQGFGNLAALLAQYRR